MSDQPTDPPAMGHLRPTATIRDLDGRPWDRNAYAAHLSEQADPAAPAEGDRVRLTYGDGSTVEGIWCYVGGDVDGWAVQPDNGPVHTHVTGQVQRTVLQRADRPRLALLNEQEAQAIAALLDELAGVYPGEDLGRLARAMAVKLYDRLGL